MSDGSFTQTGIPQQPGYPMPVKRTNGLAVAGFVLSLIGLLTCWIPLLNILSILLGVLGLILAAIGMAKARGTGSGRGLAIAGIVLGILAVVFSILINKVFVNAVDDAVDDATATSVEAPADSKKSGGDSPSGDVGSTRDNPAPLGSVISDGEWTVKVNKVTTAQADSLGQKAEPGTTILVVNLTATYKGDDEQGSTPWATVKYVGADGTSIDGTDQLLIPEKQFDSLKTVYKGGAVTGDKMLQVPSAGWKEGVLAVSPGMIADDTFVSLK